MRQLRPRISGRNWDTETASCRGATESGPMFPVWKALEFSWIHRLFPQSGHGNYEFPVFPWNLSLEVFCPSSWHLPRTEQMPQPRQRSFPVRSQASVLTVVVRGSHMPQCDGDCECRFSTILRWFCWKFFASETRSYESYPLMLSRTPSTSFSQIGHFSHDFCISGFCCLWG